MKNLYLTKELFVIPENYLEGNGENYYLYAPLKGSMLKVSPGAVGLLQKIKMGIPAEKSNICILENFLKYGVLTDKLELSEIKDKNNPLYLPTSVTLIPTHSCNLRCVYCYARAGEDVGNLMPLEIANSAVDYVIKNALETNSKRVHLGFHGGGEPLLESNFQVIIPVVERFKELAKQNGFIYGVSSATNGVIQNKSNLEWVINNFNSLNISLDGPKEIQDIQRPKADSSSSGSFNLVVETINYLNERKFNYGLRATITNDSVSRMPKILEFFTSFSKKKVFHLEPLFECGRCKTTNVKAPSSEDFLKYSRQTRDLAEKLGVSVYYSGGKLGEIGSYFCGALGSNFFVTPSGDVSTCLEVTRPKDDKAEIFLIGNYNPSFGFQIDLSKIKNLKNRSIENLSHCTDCFAKYNCKGDCPAKVCSQSGDINNPENNFRCISNQGLLFDEMIRKEKLKGGSFNQNGS
ncbi:MAG: radical SAM protein [Candidatus Nanoarchaeia archaeon]